MKRLLVHARELLEEADLTHVVCAGDCCECLIKQVEGFEQALADWDTRLAQGETPTLGGLEQMAQWGRALGQGLVDAGLLSGASLKHHGVGTTSES